MRTIPTRAIATSSIELQNQGAARPRSTCALPLPSAFNARRALWMKRAAAMASSTNTDPREIQNAVMTSVSRGDERLDESTSDTADSSGNATFDGTLSCRGSVVVAPIDGFASDTARCTEGDAEPDTRRDASDHCQARTSYRGSEGADTIGDSTHRCATGSTTDQRRAWPYRSPARPAPVRPCSRRRRRSSASVIWKNETEARLLHRTA